LTEQKKGHHGAVRILKGSLRPNGLGAVNGHFTAPVVSSRLLTEALAPKLSPMPLSRVKLREDARRKVQEIIAEWKKTKQLAAAGIQRRTRLFFYGPPGCGKTLTALAIGASLSLPTYIVRFDSVIGAYLGQTAIHLRELFRFAEHTPCVLIFDEVDALAKKRGNPLDVGELDRIVIAFMQELEHSSVQGLVVATSNLPEHIDTALWRRFDLALEFPKPSASELRQFAREIAKRFALRPAPSLEAAAAKLKSFADAERLVENEVRQKIIHRKS